MPPAALAVKLRHPCQSREVYANRRGIMPSHPRPYQATRPSTPLRGSVRVPGDRSIATRALLVAASAMGETRIAGLSANEDTLRAATAMRALGADVVQGEADDPWLVAGRGVGGLAEPAGVLDMGAAAGVTRLLAGLLASHPSFAVLTGDATLRGHSIRSVTGPLTACGARFGSREDGRLPLAVEGASDALPLDCVLPAASATVKGAVLLAGLNAPGVTELTEPAATHDHTENLLRHFGAEVEVERTRDGAGRVIRLHGQPHLRAADLTVPGDPSLAAYPLVAAVLSPGSALVIEGVGLNPLRAGLLETLREMGASIRVERARVAGGEPVGDLHVAHAALHGVDIPASRARRMIDDYPVLAVAAASARGVTRLRGVGAEVGGGRLAVVAAMLAANGVRVEVVADDLLVHGAGAPPAGGGLVAARGDHVVAMSALVLGLASAAAVRVDDAGAVDARFPGFFTLMNGLIAGAPALQAP